MLKLTASGHSDKVLEPLKYTSEFIFFDNAPSHVIDVRGQPFETSRDVIFFHMLRSTEKSDLPRKNSVHIDPRSDR